MPRLLLIDDEPVFAAAVSRSLEEEGFVVTTAATGDEGLVLMSESPPDVVLLDLRLPGTDGFEVCRRIRSESEVPVIILSARADEMDKVLGLELGADDYATKDIGARELLARIRAVMRRGSPDSNRRVRLWDGVEVDMRAREVRGSEGELVELTQLEFDLLTYLIRHRGEALRREQIFNDVWHQQQLGSSRTIDAHVVSLRAKLPSLRISSNRGVGYRFDDDS